MDRDPTWRGASVSEPANTQPLGQCRPGRGRRPISTPSHIGRIFSEGRGHVSLSSSEAGRTRRHRAFSPRISQRGVPGPLVRMRNIRNTPLPERPCSNRSRTFQIVSHRLFVDVSCSEPEWAENTVVEGDRTAVVAYAEVNMV